MFYVYVLKNEKHSLYIGYTSDLRRRITEHNRGNSIFTKSRGSWNLVYYEAYSSKSDAKQRELQLKKHGSAWGHLKKRIGLS